MDTSDNDPPSPGRNDILGTPVDDSGLNSITPKDSSKTEALGHHGAKTSGGSFPNMRVLECTRISDTPNYEMIHDKFRSFGSIQRIKMILTQQDNVFDAYITFLNSLEASTAQQHLNIEDSNYCKKSKVISITNLLDDAYDYIPDEISLPVEKVERVLPIPTWHVASYKEGQENMIRGAKAIQKKVGNIPRGNLKRYGRALLIKAGNNTQAALLRNFKASPDSNIESISPHKSFNTFKGIIYSRDLYYYEDWEILEMCPSYVFKVQKLKGDNNAILLTFTSNFVPDTIYIEHARIKVKKYYRRPTQCFKCYEYGHGYDKCKNKRKCPHCSGTHEPVEHCNNPGYCFLCEGDHSPKSRNCPRYLFEQEALEIANNQFISIGSAKQIVMGANKTPDSTYAKVIKALKTKNFKAPDRERPAPKAPEQPLPTPLSHLEGARPKDKSNEPKEKNEPQRPKEQKERSSKGASGTSNTSPRKEKVKKPKPANKTENSSKKACRDDRENVEGNIPPKRMRSYRSSEDESEILETSNSFALLDSLQGQGDMDTQNVHKPQRTRSVENIPSTFQQCVDQTTKDKTSSVNSQRRSSFSKPSLSSGSRVKKLDFNNFQQPESLHKAHAAGNK